jgi:cell fate (sporulation/competence/biofilm development) regulator YmcA (YheA/YmcA/DUF963 family)
MENVLNNLEEVITTIKESKEYKNCILLKEKMDSNIDIKDKVKRIKLLQKKYIRSGKDKDIKKELDNLEEELNNIQIYKVYLENLEKVNYMIDYVKDSLNDYFTDLLNEKY